MKSTRDEIIELMMETIVELDTAIRSRPSSKRDIEVTLVSSGFRIVQVENEEEALAWNR